MAELSPKQRGLAAQLAGTPAFLLLGEQGLERIGTAVREYRWNGVYTSCTDKAVSDVFVSETRTSTPMGPMGRTPTRGQSNLEVRYLFGGFHLPESERPPASEVEEATARSRSNRELGRLVGETLTPRGTLLIDGWMDGERLKADDLVPLFEVLGQGQVHLFSARTWEEFALVKSFVKSGRLITHVESLEETLSALLEAGASKSGAVSGGFQHVVPLGQGYVEIDIHTWNQIRRSARPIDLETLTSPNFSSDAARYQEFRNFVGATEGVPRWRGLVAGFNLKRDFESQLAELVAKEISERELPAPVIVSGQTATGKSVALASLALDLARAGEVAVLHQSRRTVRPSIEDIDTYAAWAEGKGARATVLIWDGMVEPGEYEALSRQLHARGRKVLVVGSAYKTRGDSSSVLSVPAELSKGETTRLTGLLGQFGIEVAAPVDSSFLAFLYRWLPDTEYQLRRGLSNEMRSAERMMARVARESEAESSSQSTLTAIQEAFRAAGMALEDLLPADSSDGSLEDIPFADRAPIQRVTTLVLVSGRHGIPVPIDLALRILGREGYQSIRAALASSDIVREIDDDSGDFFLGVRSQLEAELLARDEVPLSVEIEVLTDAISNVRVSEGFNGGSDEVEFLVKLLERLGPTSELKSKYRAHFGTIANALRGRREELARSQPRLVLQESSFTRDYVHWRQELKVGSVEERVSSLEFNRDLLDEVLATTTTRGLIRLSLSVELASTLGAIIYEYSHGDSSAADHGLGSRLDDVLAAVLDARAVDPGNLYPVDVLAWSTEAAIQSGSLTPEERIDRLANAVATLESLDRSALTERQLANVDRRGTELNLLLQKDDDVWRYLAKLELNTSPAATYFLAQFDAKDGPAGEVKALQRLRSAPLETRSDWRCAQLLIDLTWKEITGSRLLFGERLPLHLSETALSQIAQLAYELDTASLPDGYRLQFVRAIAAFVAGNHADAGRLFRDVGDATRQLSKRIYTSYLLADSTGQPVTYTGRVESSDTRSGQVWVNELGTRVKFEPRLFNASGEFAKNEQLPAFFIGFKLSRGPVAEPRSVFRGRAGT